MRMPATPARMHSRIMRRTAMMPPWPVSPSRMMGKFTLCAIQPAICTHSVMVAVPTSDRPVYEPTTPLVPTKPHSQPARSMMRAWVAVGGCSTTSTLSRRASNCLRRAPGFTRLRSRWLRGGGVGKKPLEPFPLRSAHVAARGFFRGVGIAALDAADDLRVLRQRGLGPVRQQHEWLAEQHHRVIHGRQALFEIAVVRPAVHG